MFDSLNLWRTITSPTKQFKQLKDQPIYLYPLLLLTLLLTALVTWKSSLVLQDPQLLRQLVPSQTTELQIQQFQQSSLITTVIIALLTVPLSSLFGAVVSWGILKFYPSTATFKQLFSFQVHLYTLAVTAVFVDTILFLFTNQLNDSPFFSLATLFPASSLTKAVLSSIELFNLWTIVLYGIGLQIIAGLSAKQAWFVSSIFFVLGILISSALSYFHITL